MSATEPSQPATQPAPERRRPRRTDEVTYRVRVDLQGAKPAIWRRLELASTMFLDELHTILQTAFGWTDSHLHRFGSGGSSVFDRGTQVYLCPYDVEEAEDDGIPEQDVRLDEVLVEVGETLLYEYDYGDGWEHVVRLEAVLDRSDDAARARVTDGRRAGPPEDCGGVGGYAELLESGAVSAEEAAYFDLAETNGSLTVALELAGLASLPGPAGDLLAKLRGDLVEHEFAQLVREAQLGEPVVIDPTDAKAMVEGYTWLLNRVGENGIALTSAGYLPPRDVEAAVAEINMGDEWIGKGNRESHLPPMLELRTSAQRFGLLRKHRGTLLLTKLGAALRGEPERLWWHLAERLLPRDDGSIARPAGIVALVGVAAGRDIRSAPFGRTLREALEALGWRNADGSPLPGWAGVGQLTDIVGPMDHLHAFTERGSWRSAQPTPTGRALARAALSAQP